MKRAKKFGNAFVFAILTVMCAICIVPILWMLRSSLMSLPQIFAVPPVLFPDPLLLDNYRQAMTVVPFARYFANSFTIVALAVSGCVVTSSLAAYSFSRLEWVGRDTVFGILLTGMMLPSIVTLIPTFIGWQYLNGIDTYLPLVLPCWLGGGAFNIFLLRQFYNTIPRELDQAATVDGAGKLRIFLSILFPLTKPATVVVALFAFMDSWNDFLAPLIYLNTEEKFTVSLGIQQFQGMYHSQWNLMMAAASVAVIPVVIIFLIGQRYFIEGIALTGIKG